MSDAALLRRVLDGSLIVISVSHMFAASLNSQSPLGGHFDRLSMILWLVSQSEISSDDFDDPLMIL